MESRTRWLECDDMGLGKTLTTLTSFLSKVDLEGQRVLVLCSTIAMGVWQEELSKWYDQKSIVYTGTPAKRKKIWEQFENARNVYTLAEYIHYTGDILPLYGEPVESYEEWICSMDKLLDELVICLNEQSIHTRAADMQKEKVK